jgi:hypothetical protein
VHAEAQHRHRHRPRPRERQAVARVARRSEARVSRSQNFPSPPPSFTFDSCTAEHDTRLNCVQLIFVKHESELIRGPRAHTHAHAHTHSHTDRQTDRQDRQTDRPTDRHIHTHTRTHTHTHTFVYTHTHTHAHTHTHTPVGSANVTWTVMGWPSECTMAWYTGRTRTWHVRDT